MELCKVKAVLLDIEGTTSSISFVKETLFPYVKKHLADYVEKHWEKDEMKNDLKILKEQSDADEKAAVEGLVPITEDSKESVVKNVLWQMELDRKTTGLKQLQGHMWREGYASGDLKGHVYSEVADALKSWQKTGKQLFVYSSGSVEAQKLLFGHSIAGDLVELFTGFYDTAVGAKVAKESYAAIAKDVGLDSEEILFLTDIAKEAEAARDAGLQVAVVVREGNAPLDEETKKLFTIIQTLDEIVFEPSSKRAKLTDEKTEIEKTTDELKPEIGEKMEIDAKAEVGAPTSEPKVAEEATKTETPEEKKIEAEPEKMNVEEKPAEEPKAEENPSSTDDKPVKDEKPDEAKSTNGEEKPEEVTSTNGEEKPKEVKPTNGEEVTSTNGEVKPTNGEEKPANGEGEKEAENGTVVEVDETNGKNADPVITKAVPVVKEAEIEGKVDPEPVVAKAVVVDGSVPIEVAAE